MDKEPSPPVVAYGSSPKGKRKVIDLSQDSPEQLSQPLLLSQAPPPPKKRRKKPGKKHGPPQGPGLLGYNFRSRKFEKMQDLFRARHARSELQRRNPNVGAMPLFSGGHPLRQAPDEPDDEPDEKAEAVKVTAGIPAAPSAMVPWEKQRRNVLKALSSNVQSFARMNPEWAENLTRELQMVAAKLNAERQGTHWWKSGPGKTISTLDLIKKWPQKAKPIVQKYLRNWKILDTPGPSPIKDHEPDPSEVPLPGSPGRELSPAVVEYGSPDKSGTVTQINNPKRDLLNAFMGVEEELPDVPDPHQSVLPQTATLRIRPDEPPVFSDPSFGEPDYPYGAEFGVPDMEPLRVPGSPEPVEFSGTFKHDIDEPEWLKPGLHKLPEGYKDVAPTPSVLSEGTWLGTPEGSEAMAGLRDDGSVGTRELMNYREQLQSRLNVLGERRPYESYMKAFVPGYKAGRPESIQRSERSVSSAFQRARSRMLNVPRGLQKSGGIRGMQVLKKQNFHIEQLSPSELVLHARIINDGVVAQVRGLVAKISRTILVDGHKVPRKGIVGHILRLLEEKNHVRITVLDS